MKGIRKVVWHASGLLVDLGMGLSKPFSPWPNVKAWVFLHIGWKFCLLYFWIIRKLS